MFLSRFTLRLLDCATLIFRFSILVSILVAVNVVQVVRADVRIVILVIVLLSEAYLFGVINFCFCFRLIVGYGVVAVVSSSRYSPVNVQIL